MCFVVDIGDRGRVLIQLNSGSRSTLTPSSEKRGRVLAGVPRGSDVTRRRAYVRSAKLIIQTECVCVCVGPIRTIKRTIPCDITRHHNPPVMSSVDITCRGPYNQAMACMEG